MRYLLTLVYDTDAPAIGYGYFHCPECSSEFYGGGPALHLADCKLKGKYEGLCYVFGPIAARKVLECGEREGLNPFLASDLLAAIPDIEELIARA